MDPAELERAYELEIFPKRPVTLVRGENARVWDDQGREYIDCVSAHGVLALGHCHPAVVEAIRRQSERLMAVSNAFYNDERAALVERLVRISPPSLMRAFLCNSGAESVEAAIKLARATTGRSEIVCAMRSFHGRTMGALSATFRKEYRQPFEPLVPGFRFVPFNNAEKLEAAVGEETAAVLLEPIQGESGVRIGEKGFFETARRVCDERGSLLVLDEVQTGFCRTGTMFACEQLGIEPDILCLAKAIAGGLPMGAVLCSERVSCPTGAHGTTLGGNPLCCAAANAAIDVMLEERLWEQARAKGDRLVKALAAVPSEKVREIRHRGLMVGIELREKVGPTIQALTEESVLTFPAGATVLRIYPPLTIEEELLDVVAERVAGVLAG